MKIPSEHIEKIKKVCEKHSVEKLYVFGSVLTPEFTNASDVDFLVRFRQIHLKDYFNNYLDLKNQLAQIVEKPVDLLEEQTLKNPILKKSIEQTRILIYG